MQEKPAGGRRGGNGRLERTWIWIKPENQDYSLGSVIWYCLLLRGTQQKHPTEKKKSVPYRDFPTSACKTSGNVSWKCILLFLDASCWTGQPVSTEPQSTECESREQNKGTNYWTYFYSRNKESVSQIFRNSIWWLSEYTILLPALLVSREHMKLQTNCTPIFMY